MLWECLECSTRYALDLQACPHCGSSERQEDGVAKISRLRGPSDARDVKPAEDNVVSESDEGSERPSPGTNSEAFTKKTLTSSGKSAAPRQRRARTTENPSSPGLVENSSADSTTTTGGPVTGGSSDAQ